MKGFLIATSGVVFVSVSLFTAVDAAEKQTLSIGKKKASYYSNRPLTVQDASITRAIIVIHGSGRKVEEYFDTIEDSLPARSDPAGNWRAKTLVIAPYFQEKRDARKNEYWWKGDWVEGGDSGGISSYKVLDTLV